LIEVREWEELTPLPRAPLYIKGVSNLRGTVTPVIGLAERLGWEPSVPHARSCTLVVSIGGKQVCFLVDEVGGIVTISDSEIQPAPELDIDEAGVIAGFVRIPAGMQEKGAPNEGVVVLLLDLKALSVTREMDLVA
tara:strand:+ start:3092 stop:3499 length:408 start_codon:yes stop_codon:yes gene_type:complete